MLNLSAAKGMIFGLAAGDKNLGPFKMALILLQSLVEAGAVYDPVVTLVGYLTWYRDKDIGWDDTGPTAAKVFQRYLQHEFQDNTPLHTSRLRRHSLQLHPLPHHCAPVGQEKLYCSSTGSSSPASSSVSTPTYSNNTTGHPLQFCCQHYITPSTTISTTFTKSSSRNCFQANFKRPTTTTAPIVPNITDNTPPAMLAMSPSGDSLLMEGASDTDAGDHENLFHHADAVHVEMRGMTGGVNAVHRCAPLSLLYHCHDPEQVLQWITMESRLTHGSAISRDSCVAFVRLLAHLLQRDTMCGSNIGISSITGQTTEQHTNSPPSTPASESKTFWWKVVQSTADEMKQVFAVSNALLEGLDTSMRPHLSRGGYCLDVLRAAVYFVSHTSSFEEALQQSLSFAGPANYCPVLVGALAGALYGVEAVPQEQLRHWPNFELALGDKCLTSLVKIMNNMIHSHQQASYMDNDQTQSEEWANNVSTSDK